MGWEDVDPFEYHPERGLYYHGVWPALYCGTQPRTKSDVDFIAKLLEPQGSIVSLQQEKDLQYWGVNLDEIRSQAQYHSLPFLPCPVIICSCVSLS